MGEIRDKAILQISRSNTESDCKTFCRALQALTFMSEPNEETRFILIQKAVNSAVGLNPKDIPAFLRILGKNRATPLEVANLQPLMTVRVKQEKSEIKRGILKSLCEGLGVDVKEVHWSDEMGYVDEVDESSK